MKSMPRKPIRVPSPAAPALSSDPGEDGAELPPLLDADVPTPDADVPTSDINAIISPDDVLQAAEALFSVALAFEDATTNLGVAEHDYVIAAAPGGYRWVAPGDKGARYAAQQGWSVVNHIALLGLDA